MRIARSLSSFTVSAHPKLPKFRPNAQAQPAEDPTFVERNPNTIDGEWRPEDQKLVKHSLKQAHDPVFEHTVGSGVLLGKSIEQLQELVVYFGQPKYRAKQIYDSLLQGASSVAEINLIPKVLREDLTAAGIKTGRSRHHDEVVASDGTRKLLRQLSDGRVIETVGIPMTDTDEPKLTACVSSQVGCPMRCTFCATGKGGFARNLAVHEIIDQVLAVRAAFNRRVSNVVFMGMGEPLLNLPAVVQAVRFINEHIGIGARNITISTVGVRSQLPALAQHGLKCTLAVSLHAPSQELRERLVPSARAFPLPELLRACTDYFNATSRRVTFEYTLLRGVNDSHSQAIELVHLLRAHKLVTHVNLIPWNPVEDGAFKRPKSSAVTSFKNVLEKNGVSVTVRVTRGLDAAAACGQLRNLHQKQALENFSPCS